MVQMVGDGVVTSAFEKFIGVSADDNPVIPSVKEGAARLYELSLRETDAGDPVTETSTDEEVLCSLFETGADFDLTAGYEDLYEALTNVATMEGLMRLSVSQVAWRVQLWRQLPACAEHYDIAYLLSHLTSDLVAVIALVNAGVDHELNPYLESISESQSALQDFFSEQTLRQGPQNVPTLKLTLPACGVDELDGIGRGQDSYVDLVFQMNTGVYSNQELTAFAEAMLAWRDDYLPKVPPCEEAVAVAMLESWLTGDFISDTVTMWIGVPAEDNFYAEQRGANNVRLTERGMALSAADASAAPATTTDMLHACDEAQLDEVFGNAAYQLPKPDAERRLHQRCQQFPQLRLLSAVLATIRMGTPAALQRSAYAMPMLMNEYATDAVSYHALRFVNVDDEDNPFWDKLGHLLERFDELTAASGRDL